VKLHVHYVRDKINPEGPVDFFLHDCLLPTFCRNYSRPYKTTLSLSLLYIYIYMEAKMLDMHLSAYEVRVALIMEW
jgi:hypothetical protein